MLDPIKQAAHDKKQPGFHKKIWNIFCRLEQTCSARQKRHKALTEPNFIIKFKKNIHSRFIDSLKNQNPYRVCFQNEYKPLQGRPIIFAPNHACGSDVPIALQAIRQHCYILAGKQPLNISSFKLFQTNGTIWVDRTSKTDRMAAQKALAAYLKKGESILWFPEGTWNVTENLPILPLRWGIVKTAKVCHAQIIPMNLSYDRKHKTVFIRFANPMADEALNDPEKAIQNLRDIMATLWWESLTAFPCEHRTEDLIKQERLYTYKLLVKYPPLDVELEQASIYSPIR